MKLNHTWTLLVFLMISGHGQAASPTSITPTDQYRQQLIKDHKYWRWTGEVRRDAPHAVHGLIVGLRGWNTNGSFDSWGWFNNDSEKLWVITRFVSIDGKKQEWKISTKDHPEAQDLPEQNRGLEERLQAILGPNITAENLQDWITGSSSEGKLKYAEDLSGRHLQSSSGKWGRLYFPEWVPVATTEGKPLTLPTYWVLDNSKGKTVLTVSSFEAYSVKDLPYAQWPYQKPEASVENFFDTPTLEIPNDQLDYDQW